MCDASHGQPDPWRARPAFKPKFHGAQATRAAPKEGPPRKRRGCVGALSLRDVQEPTSHPPLRSPKRTLPSPRPAWACLVPQEPRTSARSTARLRSPHPRLPFPCLAVAAFTCSSASAMTEQGSHMTHPEMRENKSLGPGACWEM